MSVRLGIGYDIHRLEKKRKLVLGGVEIPHEAGLAGHSDADVLLHAICDAILGALGQGDIGEHFPDTRPEFKDVSSLVFLKRVEEIARAQGYAIGNIDAIVQAEAPKLNKHKEAMKRTIAKALKIDASSVNIKATTMEGLGAIGNKEGIAAFASVVLEKKED
jgi:2-C-methyl-D-erythritol 2,4-cyclodiphosphate synthase